eukprot:c2991_g1_i1.p1 GENE.c2991_g1_i1~~c2991_g1_i1.p1  ORF type:complete len:103 (-),score=23.48 c2991_g1_i1:80-388(-)
MCCSFVWLQIGFGPIVWLLISEIFPNSIRSRAVAISVFTNFGANIVVAFSYSVMDNEIGLPATFLVYSALCVVSIGFVLQRLPETKGKRLEEIAKLFDTKFQ